MAKREGETYLGDGLFARFDGFSIWLLAPREDGDHEVCLEPQVFVALMNWYDSLRQKGGTQ